MASFADQARLAADPNFAEKVRVAALRAAANVQAELDTVVNHVARTNLAHQILSSAGTSQVNNFAWAAATGANSLADNYVTAGRDATTLVDGDIEFVVNSLWDAMSGPG